jgi:hypothetical protein
MIAEVAGSGCEDRSNLVITVELHGIVQSCLFQPQAKFGQSREKIAVATEPALSESRRGGAFGRRRAFSPDGTLHRSPLAMEGNYSPNL